MGWKTFKNHFGIQHIVKVEDDQILIGSGYIGDLGTVCMKTGELKLKDGWERSLAEYESLHKATPEERLKTIQAVDQFDSAVKVYLTLDGKVYEDLCEAVGYPNVTHSGKVMYENTTFFTFKEAQARAIRTLESYIKSYEERRDRILKEIEEIDAEILAARNAKAELVSK